MKTLLILIFLALASIATAFPARFKWNKNPAGEGITEYRIHQIVDGVPVLRLTHPATAGPETVERSVGIEVESGQVYTVTAFNGLTSEPSDPVTIPVRPSKPAAVEVVEVQVSTNLTDWKPIAFVPLKTSDSNRFLRARITTLPTP